MTTELYAMAAIGVAIIGMNWRMYATLRRDVTSLGGRLDTLQTDMSGVKERLSALEATVGLIVQGLHIEVKGR